MKIRIPLFIKLMLPLTLLMILTIGISGYRVYRESTQRWQTEMDIRLERVVTLLSRTVDVTTLQQLETPADIDRPEYEAIVQQLEQALTASNLDWIGIYHRKDDYFYYWVDYDYTGVGYPFFYATPEHFAAYQDRQPHRVQYTDEFGSYYGFIAPIITTDENGVEQVLGLVEALILIESRDLLQQNTLERVLLIVIGGIIIAVLLSLGINHLMINRPVRRLQRGALALAHGRFGHTIDLNSHDELEDLANTFNRMSSRLETLYRERAEQERIQRELEIAHNVQQALFPSEIPKIVGLEITAICRPHRETSGDFYDLLALDDGQLGVVVGDVSGKSIPAAMVMVAAQSIIRSEAHNHIAPELVLNQSNALLHHNIPRGMFVAASYARFDVQRGQMVWANAGQVYPLLLHRTAPANGQETVRYLETMGLAFPLGISGGGQYNGHQVELLSGDTVLFYTDGVIEAMNSDGQLYGFERLEGLMRSLNTDFSPRTLIETILEDITTFVGPAEQHDDITLVAIKVVGQ
jgi:sigma-B regulation protein RsbU (phosphoserine phosphatase)